MGKWIPGLLLIHFLILPGEPAPPAVTLALAGDVMLGRGVAQALGGDWSAAFAPVAPALQAADWAIANLESPLTTASQVVSGHDLRAPPEAVAALQAAGFDALTLANNHALDAGEAGRAQTQQVLLEAGLEAVREDEPFCTPLWCLLAFQIPPTDPQAVIETITAIDTAGRFLVLSLHWGGEFQASPSNAQRALARALVEAGADLIVGHGPHVLQPIEWVEGNLVAYSLGNLLFDQPYPADGHQGAILQVTVQAEQILAVEVVPVVIEQGRVLPAGTEEAIAIRHRLGLECRPNSYHGLRTR